MGAWGLRGEEIGGYKMERRQTDRQTQLNAGSAEAGHEAFRQCPFDLTFPEVLVSFHCQSDST